MDYLAILKNLDPGKADASGARADVAEPYYETNEFNEKGPVQPADSARRSPQCPGPELCTGCYSISVIDGRERFIHPPKASPQWQEWLERWQPKGKVQ